VDPDNYYCSIALDDPIERSASVQWLLLAMNLVARTGRTVACLFQLQILILIQPVLIVIVSFWLTIQG
jgi:hypothetical protein